MAVSTLVAAVEADPRGRAFLQAAVTAARAADPWTAATRTPPSGREDREARAHEGDQAVGRLVDAGLVAADGPGRVCLPGFGRSTWRAIGVLRAPAGPSHRRWAAAVAREPLTDLGRAAPPLPPAPTPHPELVALARRVHHLEAVRQDARNALLTAEARMAEALGRGHQDSARMLREEVDGARRAIAALDLLIAEVWEVGVRAGGAGEPSGG
jgi:hypothetical protein